MSSRNQDDFQLTFWTLAFVVVMVGFIAFCALLAHLGIRQSSCSHSARYGDIMCSGPGAR